MYDLGTDSSKAPSRPERAAHTTCAQRAKGVGGGEYKGQIGVGGGGNQTHAHKSKSTHTAHAHAHTHAHTHTHTRTEREPAEHVLKEG